MADYWKSLPRKFCEFCKCWITDNKPSVEFHERGKRHKENVEKKINEVRKKGQKQYEKEKAIQKDLEAMEEAALKAYEKDMKLNPTLAKPGSEIIQSFSISKCSKTFNKPTWQENYSVCSTKTAPSSSIQQHKKSKKFKGEGKKKTFYKAAIPAEESTASTTVKEWYEAVSDEGYTYYWNENTGESKWEAPEEGFVSLADQANNTEATTEPDVPALEVVNMAEGEEAESSEEESMNSEEDVQNKTEKDKPSDSNDEEKCEDSEDSNDKLKNNGNEISQENKEVCPDNSAESKEEIEVKEEVCDDNSQDSEIQIQSKKNTSQVIGKRKSAYGEWVPVTIQEPVDLELPDRVTTEISLPNINNTEPKFKFKEKTITSLEGSSEQITFKKRKVDVDRKKCNMRKREVDDS